MIICTTCYAFKNLNYRQLKSSKHLWILTENCCSIFTFFPLLHKSEHVMNTLRFVYLIEIIESEQSEHICSIISSI